MDKKVVLSGVRNVYFLGIGGIGMSGLALLLNDKGFKIKGSDIKHNSNIDILKKEGIEVFIGHKKENITSDIHLLVYSSAVREDNPEIREAKLKGITLLKRGELLGLLSWDKKTIAISGSHGKTTTTALFSYLLTSLGYSPTAFVGGVPLNSFRNAWWGGDYFVIETDESDGSFLHYNPWVSVITNIDYEHIDYYKTMDNLRASFLQFAFQTKEKVFGWGDDAYIKKLLSETGGWSYGWGENNRVRAANVGFDGKFTTFSLFIDGKFISKIKTSLLGEHNVLNTLSALSFFFFMGEDLTKVAEFLEGFKGTQRRFSIRETVEGVTFVDDYAHHPTEIRAVLSAARCLNPKKLFVIFQPHRFSRVNALYKEFGECFAAVDELVVTDIYSASEDNIEGVNIEWLYEGIKQKFCGKIHYIPANKLAQEVPQYLTKGDLVMGLGAGDINLIMAQIIEEFKESIGQRA